MQREGNQELYCWLCPFKKHRYAENGMFACFLHKEKVLLALGVKGVMIAKCVFTRQILVLSYGFRQCSLLTVCTALQNPEEVVSVWANTSVI